MRLSIITLLGSDSDGAAGNIVPTTVSLLCSLARAPDVTVEWVLVRTAREGQEPTEGPADIKNVRVRSIGDMAAGDDSDVTRAGGGTASERLLVMTGPACAAGPGTARNVGLARATGDYIVFLAPDTVVTEDWISVAESMARQGAGWRCRTLEIASAIDVSKPVRIGTMKDRQRAVPPTTVDSTCWGAPAQAFAGVFGFDAAFDGGDAGHDLEAAIRLARAGLAFVTLSHAAVIRRRPLKPQPKDASGGTQNKSLLTKLVRDRRRTIPLSISTAGAAPVSARAVEASPAGEEWTPPGPHAAPREVDHEDPTMDGSVDETNCVAPEGDRAPVDDTFGDACEVVETIAGLEFTLDDATLEAGRVQQRADAALSHVPGTPGGGDDVRATPAFDLSTLEVDPDEVDTIDILPPAVKVRRRKSKRV
jgi:hypothetical protein